MAIDRDLTSWRDMHDRILGVEVIKGTSITCSRIEEGYPFKDGVDLAVSVSENYDLSIGMAFSKVNKGPVKSETMAGIMHQIEKVLRDGYMTVGEGQFDTIKGRLQCTGEIKTIKPIAITLYSQNWCDSVQLVQYNLATDITCMQNGSEMLLRKFGKQFFRQGRCPVRDMRIRENAEVNGIKFWHASTSFQWDGRKPKQK